MIVTIVGLGVIGGSYALSLKDKEKEIYAIDVDGGTLEKAKEAKVIREGYKYLSDKSYELVANTDLLILCLYPEQIEKFIINYKDYFKENLIITDVCGVKSEIVDKVESILPENVDFVFTHPMAGREKKGFEYASDTIFNNANFIIVPRENNKLESIKTIENLAKELGFKNIMKINEKEHDKIISFTSQLPHAIAVALINSDNLEVDTGRFIGDSYKELTRIANINDELWSELFLYNKENLLEMISSFEGQLSLIKNALVNNDEELLRLKFIESSKRREKL